MQWVWCIGIVFQVLCQFGQVIGIDNGQYVVLFWIVGFVQVGGYVVVMFVDDGFVQCWVFVGEFVEVGFEYVVLFEFFDFVFVYVFGGEQVGFQVYNEFDFVEEIQLL